MTEHVTDNMVLRYVLEDLPAKERRIVEEAFPDNAEVRAWFERLGERPDNVAESASQESVCTLSEARYLPPDPVDRAVYAFAVFLCSEPDEPAREPEVFPRLLRMPANERFTSLAEASHLRREIELSGGLHVPSQTIPLAGQPARKASEVPMAIPNDYLQVDAVEVALDYPADKVPFALGWLILREANGKSILHLPVLHYNDERRSWWFRDSLKRLLGRPQPTSELPSADFLPANQQTREHFAGKEVEDFVRSLSEDSRQRQLAQSFLSSLGE